MSDSTVISAALPTQKDLTNSEAIMEILKKENRFPSDEENKKREEVLAKLDGIIKGWVKQVCLKQVCCYKVNIKLNYFNNNNRVCLRNLYHQLDPSW